MSDEEYHLKDIMFEIYQAQKIIKIREGLIFSVTGKKLNTALKQLEENKKRLIKDYELTYQKSPDLTFAKRIFTRDAKEIGVTW